MSHKSMIRTLWVNHGDPDDNFARYMILEPGSAYVRKYTRGYHSTLSYLMNDDWMFFPWRFN